MLTTSAETSTIAPSGSTTIVKIPPLTIEPPMPKMSNTTAIMYNHIPVDLPESVAQKLLDGTPPTTASQSGSARHRRSCAAEAISRATAPA